MRGQCSKTGDHICAIKCARNLGTQLSATDLTLHVFQSHFVLLNNGNFMASNTISVTLIPDTLPVLYKCIASFFFDGNRHWVFVPVLLYALYLTVSLKLSFNMAFGVMVQRTCVFHNLCSTPRFNNVLLEPL